MGFIAEFDENWADEMDVFGLKYFDSMDDYLYQFSYYFVVEFFGISPLDVLTYLHLPIPDYEFKNEEKLFNAMNNYFTSHMGEMRKRYCEVTSLDSPLEKDSIYNEFICAAILILLANDPNFNMWDHYCSFPIGTNEYIEGNAGEYFDVLREPLIFAEGKVADAIIEGDKNYCRGAFYF